jgi:hypothetical protein
LSTSSPPITFPNTTCFPSIAARIVQPSRLKKRNLITPAKLLCRWLLLWASNLMRSRPGLRKHIEVLGLMNQLSGKGAATNSLLAYLGPCEVFLYRLYVQRRTCKPVLQGACHQGNLREWRARRWPRQARLSRWLQEAFDQIRPGPPWKPKVRRLFPCHCADTISVYWVQARVWLLFHHVKHLV